MKEIRFRAWNKVDQTMYGDAVNNCKDTFDMVLKHPQIYEVMQYTGVNDKNGVRVYEGSIIKGKAPDGQIITNGLIEFQGCDFIVKISEGSARGFYYLHHILCDTLEVIGNCFENPELMEVSNG